MNKLLVVSGPTATGKTALAISLAKKFNGEIVSADSRQVYRGMDIGTGKDLPPKAKIKYPWFSKVGYYDFDGVKVWGMDLVGPRQEFSISQYLKFARKILNDIEKRGKLPIIVGGTGFYIKGVVDGISTASIPRNDPLRKNLEGKSVNDLFESLSQIDSIKAASLNSSDRKNPHRLVRAIEVAQFLIDHKLPIHRSIANKDLDILFIGLTAERRVLDERIEGRVEGRVKRGIKKEIEKLLASKVSWDDQSMLSLGYRQYRDFFEGGVPEEVVIDEWKREERRYAKRQMVWFKKDKRVNWFDITGRNFPGDVEKFVGKWHNMSNVAKN